MKDYHYDFSQLYMLLQMAKGDRTAKEWAQAAGITEASLSRMLSGKQPVKLSSIEKLAAGGLKGGVTKEQLIEAITPMSKPVTDDVNQMENAIDSLRSRFRKGPVDTSLFKDYLNATEKANQLAESIHSEYIKRATEEIYNLLVMEYQMEFSLEKDQVRLTRKRDLKGYSSEEVTPDVHFTYLQGYKPEACAKDEKGIVLEDDSDAVTTEISAYSILTAGMSFEERQAKEKLLDEILKECKTTVDDACEIHTLLFLFDEMETYTLFRTWLSIKKLPKGWSADIAMVDFDNRYFENWITA